MNYFDEGFNGYLNGETARQTGERLGLNWIKYGEQAQQVQSGHNAAQKLERDTRPAHA